MASYIPGSDGALRNWASNFSARTTANPSTYGLMPSDAAAIAAAANAFLTALTAATDPITRTQGAVAAKDSARAAMLITLRHYAQFIKRNLGVTNQEKQDLGLTINDTTRSPIPAPVTKPLCEVMDADSLRHTLRFRDAGTPRSRAKPASAVGVEVYYILQPTSTTAPPITPNARADGVIFAGIATRYPFTITFDPADLGKTVTYYVRWITRTGLVGPWSDATSKMVAA